jgi:hypothetical protein
VILAGKSAALEQTTIAIGPVFDLTPEIKVGFFFALRTLMVIIVQCICNDGMNSQMFNQRKLKMFSSKLLEWNGAIDRLYVVVFFVCNSLHLIEVDVVYVNPLNISTGTRALGRQWWRTLF